MSRRNPLSSEQTRSPAGIPTDPAEMATHYVLPLAALTESAQPGGRGCERQRSSCVCVLGVCHSPVMVGFRVRIIPRAC